MGAAHGLLELHANVLLHLMPILGRQPNVDSAAGVVWKYALATSACMMRNDLPLFSRGTSMTRLAESRRRDLARLDPLRRRPGPVRSVGLLDTHPSHAEYLLPSISCLLNQCRLVDLSLLEEPDLHLSRLLYLVSSGSPARSPQYLGLVGSVTVNTSRVQHTHTHHSSPVPGLLFHCLVERDAFCQNCHFAGDLATIRDYRILFS